MNPTFSGEVQFAGYADGSRGGPRVTLRLTDRAELEKFVGMEGRRFMAVLVEIGDDEQPVQEPSKEIKRERMGPLCEWAVYRCKEGRFQEWIRPVYDRHMGGNGKGWGDVLPEDVGGHEAYAAHAVKVLCEVESRKDLDADVQAGKRFKRRVMDGYALWLKREEAAA